MGLTKQTKTDRHTLRNFGLIMSVMVLLIFIVMLPWLFGLNRPSWPWPVSGTLIGLALFTPLFLEPLYKTWMRFANMVGKVNTTIVLGLIYYFVVCPYATVIMIMRKDFMNRKWDNQCVSYRQTSKSIESQDFERPF